MANNFKLAHNIKTFYNQYDISCPLNQSDIALARPVIDIRTFCGNQQIASSSYSPTLSFNGFADYVDDQWDEISFGTMTSTTVGAIGNIYGTTRGDESYDVIGLANARATPASVGGVIGLSGGVTGQQLLRGKALCVDQAVTGTGAQTGVNVGAITAGLTTGVIYRLTAATALTTITAVIQHSSDSTNGTDGTWATVTGLSFTATGLTWELDSVTTGTSAWLRVNTTAFTGTSATLTIVAGRLI
jgi:hypothetical protein